MCPVCVMSVEQSDKKAPLKIQRSSADYLLLCQISNKVAIEWSIEFFGVKEEALALTCKQCWTENL